MNMIDLHMHSTASDGTDTPAQIVGHVRDAGIRTFALTDHDTDRGVAEAIASLRPGMRFFRGIEFSCLAENGKLHLLGYGYDPENADFRNAIALGEKKRHDKLEKRLTWLREEYGICLTEEERNGLFSMYSPGKPQIADLIMSHGYGTDRGQVIRDYIDTCQTGVSRIEAKTAVAAILSAGGFPVWAHPLGGENEPRIPQERFEALLEEMTGYGIVGLECWYSRYSPDETAFLVRHAEARRLLISGGSDYHGTRKNILLGTLNAASAPVTEEQLTILDAMKDRAITV